MFINGYISKLLPENNFLSNISRIEEFLEVIDDHSDSFRVCSIIPNQA